jgi:GAF domain-containing protein
MPTFTLPDPVSDPSGDQTLARLIEHVRALLPVDAVVIVTVDEARGRVERSAGWFADPALGETLGPPGSHPLDERRRGLARAILERERPLLLRRLDEWEAAPALFEAIGEPGKAFGSASAIACPLRAEAGAGLGVLVVASLDHQRPLREQDLGTVEVVADLAAMALERAALLEVETRRARDELTLKRAGDAVSSSLELADVYRSVVQHAAAATGADQAVLARLDSHAGELRTVATLDPSPGAAGPGAAVAGSGQAEVARGRKALTERHGSLMHAPIELGPRLYGVLSAAAAEPGRFDDSSLELLTRLARSSAAAIANAIDFQRERHIARSLTLGFVPESLPRVPDYETGLLYAPALGEPTGGDLYGVWELPSGDVAALVGDVAGKGVGTAALSAMVRFFVEARSWDASSPARVLEQTNAMLTGRLPGDTFVTAFLAVLGTRSLRWASAGHLPPLHLSGEEIQELGATGVPLGVSERATYGERKLKLRDGDLVFAYTDGLVEARRERESFGEERLAELVRRLAPSLAPEELAKRVHEEVVAWSGGLGDDAVALALRRKR